MKRLLIFCATIFIHYSAISQIPVNLVPNPSFENGTTNTNSCIRTIFGLDNWVSLGFTGPNNTPEWRNTLRDLDPLVLGGCAICSNPIQTNPF